VRAYDEVALGLGAASTREQGPELGVCLEKSDRFGGP
jgi:hypothetical protein